MVFSTLNFFAITLLVLRVMYLSSNLVGVNIQPRYLLPFLFPVVGSLLIYIPNLINRNMMTLIIFIFFSGISYLFSFHIWIQHFTAGSNNFALNLNSNFEWWWNSFLLPTPLWLLSTLIYVSILLFCILGNTTTTPPTRALHVKRRNWDHWFCFEIEFDFNPRRISTWTGCCKESWSVTQVSRNAW